jgi:hypothetical protein
VTVREWLTHTTSCDRKSQGLGDVLPSSKNPEIVFGFAEKIPACWRQGGEIETGQLGVLWKPQSANATSFRHFARTVDMHTCVRIACYWEMCMSYDELRCVVVLSQPWRRKSSRRTYHDLAYQELFGDRFLSRRRNDLQKWRCSQDSPVSQELEVVTNSQDYELSGLRRFLQN